AWRAITHLVGSRETSVEATWYALMVIGVVIVLDFSRTIVSRRASRRYRSAALSANALHFGSDLAGSGAVLIGLLLVRAGYARADSAAALFVAVLVLVAAARLMQRNVDVLMDRAPADAEEAARAAIAGIEPAVTLGRLRMRQAGPRQFADVVITVPPGAAVGQGHAAADQVEDALHEALPGSDVVVHGEPAEGGEASRVCGAGAAAAAVAEPPRVARPAISDAVADTARWPCACARLASCSWSGGGGGSSRETPSPSSRLRRCRRSSPAAGPPGDMPST